MTKQEFQELLNQPHEAEKFDRDKQKNLDVPIGELERRMDVIFGSGNWGAKNTNITKIEGEEVKKETGEVTIGNIIICTLDLWYIHPVSGEMRTNAGIASNFFSSTQARTTASATASFAKKNAIELLGNYFGRGLSRKLKTPSPPPDLNDAIVKVTSKLAEIETIEQVNDMYKQMPEMYLNNPSMTIPFHNRISEIKKAQQS